jgi:hypothetical protein
VDDIMPLWPGEEDDDTPLPTHEELAASLPVLDPSISQIVIEEREDRV